VMSWLMALAFGLGYRGQRRPGVRIDRI